LVAVKITSSGVLNTFSTTFDQRQKICLTTEWCFRVVEPAKRLPELKLPTGMEILLEWKKAATLANEASHLLSMESAK
jgi:hypothetical protein